MKYLKMMGLAAVAALALLAVVDTAYAVLFEGKYPPWNPLVAGLFLASFCTLGATAPRNGKSQQSELGESLTHHTATVTETNETSHTLDTVTVDPQMRIAQSNAQLPNPHDREAPPITPVMVC